MPVHHVTAGKAGAVVDIDANNAGNPLACAEYARDIFDHLHAAEVRCGGACGGGRGAAAFPTTAPARPRPRTARWPQQPAGARALLMPPRAPTPSPQIDCRPDPRYLETTQRDMSPHMRAILVDWLVEVALEYRLSSDTLHLTFALLDRFLSAAPVPRDQLQLAGIACMWAAAKYEEIYAPSAKDFCFITDNTYTPQQVLARDGGRRVVGVGVRCVARPQPHAFAALHHAPGR